MHERVCRAARALRDGLRSRPTYLSRHRRLSHTAWTGMLAPALLDILVEANKVAGLDGTKAHRCLLRQLPSVTYTELDTYACERLGGNLALHYTYALLVQNTANASRLGHLLRRLQHTWTSGPSRRVSPRAYYLHAPLDGPTTTDWNRRINLHHAGTGLTHLRGSLGSDCRITTLQRRLGTYRCYLIRGTQLGRRYGKRRGQYR